MKKARKNNTKKRAANKIKSILSVIILMAIFLFYLQQENSRPATQPQTQPQSQPQTQLQTESSAPAAEELFLELPQMDGNEKLINYEGFTVCYNENALIPYWVAYEMENYETDGEITRKGKRFRPDNALPYRQAEDDDYRNSGWARGHMAPAADFKWSDKAMSDTFYFTNCCPQNSSLNGGMWSTLEKKTRDASVEYGTIWVITGPIIGKNRYGTIGANNVTVPDAFFKAMLIHDGNQYHSIAFVMENCKQSANMQKCAMSVNNLEKRISTDLFAALDDSIEESVEEDYRLSVWNL